MKEGKEKEKRVEEGESIVENYLEKSGGWGLSCWFRTLFGCVLDFGRSGWERNGYGFEKKK